MWEVRVDTRKELYRKRKRKREKENTKERATFTCSLFYEYHKSDGVLNFCHFPHFKSLEPVLRTKKIKKS